MRLLSIENHPGQPALHHGLRITPFAQTWRVRPPFSVPHFSGGLVWSRPVSVLVTRPDGSETVLPVPDPTRWIVWSLYAACAALALLAGMMNVRSRRRVGNG
jgi:hypothetical protein